MTVRAEATHTASQRAEHDAPVTANGEDAERQKVPWHFKVLVVALVFYLGFRLVQLIILIAHWL